MYNMIQSGFLSLLQNWKYGLRNCPFIGESSRSPWKFSSLKVLLPPSSAILKGPNQRGSNLPCFPLSALRTSHLSTRSPTCRLLSLACWSNSSFIFSWYSTSFWFTWLWVSSSSTSWLILLITSSGSSWLSYINRATGKASCIGKTDARPYTNS